MRSPSIANNEILKLFGFEKVPLIAGHNVKAIGVAEATFTTAYFLFSKY